MSPVESLLTAPSFFYQTMQNDLRRARWEKAFSESRTPEESAVGNVDTNTLRATIVVSPVKLESSASE